MNKFHPSFFVAAGLFLLAWTVTLFQLADLAAHLDSPIVTSLDDDKVFLIVSGIQTLAVVLAVYAIPKVRNFVRAHDINARAAFLVIGLFVGWWVGLIVSSLIGVVLFVMAALFPYAFVITAAVAVYSFWRAIKGYRQPMLSAL